MAKTNITLKIDSKLLKAAKILAAQQDTSISALLATILEEKVERNLQYEQAKEAALADLDQGFDLGFRPPASRDELHER